MEVFRPADFRAFSGNTASRISEEWMLLTAGSPEGGVATMTVNWGAMGYLWHNDFVMIAVRRSRNTLAYLEREGAFSLAFFPEDMHAELRYCGQVSGRSEDKVAHCGFTTAYERGIPYFRQAHTVLLCRTMYRGDIAPDGFADREVYRRWYEEGVHKGDMHRFFLAKVENMLVRESS